MRLCVLFVLSLTFAANATTPECLISFDSARLDVCEGRAALLNENLRGLADAAAFDDSNIRIVKFGGPVTTSQRAALIDRGAEILGYVPYHGYKVRMAPAADRLVREIPGVVWAGPYLPAFKVGINLSNELLDGRILDVAGGELDSLLITLQRGVSADQARAALEAVPGLSYGFSGQGHDHEFVVMRFERALLGAIVQSVAADQAVDAVSFHWPAEFLNAQAGWLHQGGLGDTSHFPVFEQGIFGCGQIAAMADSGLFVDHCSFDDPVFGDAVWTSCGDGTDCPAITPDFGHRKVGAHYKWSGNAGGPADEHGHGTHVAGSIIGNNRADVVDCQNYTTAGGKNDLDGTAPGAQFISQEMGGELEYLNDLGGTLYHAATVAYENGARVHNNSWGSSCRIQGLVCIPGCEVEYRAHSRGGDAAVWENPDLAIFVAAGNSGGPSSVPPGCGPGADVGAPGNGKNIFSIGSTLRGASGDAMSGFSSRGPTSDRRTKPDLTAQGSSIISAQRDACGTRSSSGTSMASPTAAGLGLLVREYLQRGFYPLGTEDPGSAMASPSAALIKAIMINGAENMSGSGVRDDAPNQDQGWGRVLLNNSLYFEGDERNLWLHDGSDGLTTGGQDVHSITVADGQPLIVTLVWHDYPAEINAQPHIVNVLRLEVETPDGQVWSQKLEPPAPPLLPDNPDPYQDTTSGNFDTTNTVHQIRLDEPAAGEYQIRVSGIAVAMGDAQPYALAATGDLQDVGQPDFLLRATPASASACQGDEVDIELSLRSVMDFAEPVTLSTAGLPAGVAGTFSVNPVTPADPAATSVLTLSGLDAPGPGEYAFAVEGSSASRTRAVEIDLAVFDGAPGATTVTSPADGDQDVPLHPLVVWTDAEEAAQYELQIATDADFQTLVRSAVTAGTSHTVSAPLEMQTGYYLRVRAVNGCGLGAWSETVFFTTELVAGECPADTQAERVFYENFDGGALPAGWSTLGSVGTVTWQVSDVRGFDGDYSVFAENIAISSDQRLATPAIALPDDAEALFLTFHNWQHIESDSGGCFDGGLLEVSTDGGLIWTQVEEEILFRPYDGEISVQWGNPLAGMPAWCGDPRDFWDRYAVDLSSWAGSDVRFRFRLGTDGLQDREGWYVDAVEVKACQAQEDEVPPPPEDVVFEDRFEQ